MLFLCLFFLSVVILVYAANERLLDKCICTCIIDNITGT